MKEETCLLEAIIILVGKYNYTMSDFSIDADRIEIGLLKNSKDTKNAELPFLD